MLLAYNFTELLSQELAFSYHPIIVLISLEEPIRMRFFLFFLLIGGVLAFYAMFLDGGKEYRAGVREVLPGIKTPLPAGEYQHGSAKWLDSSKFPKVFTKVVLKRRDEMMQYLLETGDADLYDDYNPADDQPVEYQPVKAGGLVVGQPKKNVLYLDTQDTHGYILGATRSSKTRTIVLKSIILTALAGESMILSDVKPELHSYTAFFLRRLGYEVLTLDFNCPAKSDQYNFLQIIIDHVNNGEDDAAKDAVWELVEQLVGKQSPTGEQLWRNGECSIIACCIMAVVYDNRHRPEYQNLTNVYHFISQMCRAQKGKKTLPLEQYLNAQDESHPAKGLCALSNVAPDRTKGSFFASAIATLRLFESNSIASMTCKTSFDIYSTGKKKRAIFILLPDEKKAYYSIASLFVTQHYQTLVETTKSHGNRLPRRVNFFMDEAGNFTYISVLSAIYTAGAGRGIRFFLFLQDSKQLDEIYGQNVSSVIRGNSETWIYLRSTDQGTLDEISKKLGNYTTSTPNASSTATTTGGSSSAGTGLMGRPLLMPEEVRKVERPYQLVLTSHDPAIMLSPDLAKSFLNDLLGMGDKKHNENLIMVRESRRKERRITAPELWGIWHDYEYDGGDEGMPLPEPPPFDFNFHL